MDNQESQTVEFKRSLAERKEILETISAFANTRGGRIYVGVEEDKDGSVRKVVGVEIKGKEVENLGNEIKQNTDPIVYPSIEVGEIEGRPVLVLEVKESQVKPVFAKIDKTPVAYKRVGKTNQKMDVSELRRILSTGREFLWDSQVCEEATLDDVDEEKVRWFLRKAKVERNLDINPNTPVREALERLKLLKRGRLTNAAILLFGNDPQKFSLQAMIRCARFKGNTAIDFLDMKIIDGNIIDQIDDAEKFILSHIKKAAKVVMFEREEVWEYPPDAIREAIVNAVCHRDYGISGNVRVAVFDDRLEITNPGRLPEPLTPKMLKQNHESIPRNRVIANAFFLIRNIEQWGKGTNKIVQWCVKHGLREPDFEEIAGGFMVKFHSPEDLLSLIPEKGKIDLKDLGLNERQIKALRLMVNEGKVFTNKTYREQFKVSNQTCVRDMRLLNKLDLISKEGKGKNVRYKAK